MAHRLHELAAEVAEIPARLIPAAAAAVVDVAAAEARRATGDGRMSGMGRRGPRLRAVARTSSTSRGARAEVAGVPAGAWAILESGAAAHVIGPVRRAGVLAGPGLRHPVRGPLRHPGAAGKRAWSHVVDAAGDLVPEMAEDLAAEVLA